MVNVEIIAVGNEILLGLVQDTNSNYLCRVVRGMGGRVCHITIVRDEINSIAEELKASINRRADLVFTCGGLGPTDDDLTLAAVAAALGRQLVLDQAALRFVERKYSELASAGYVASPRMTDERLKMARLPEGARAIENPVGRRARRCAGSKGRPHRLAPRRARRAESHSRGAASRVARRDIRPRQLPRARSDRRVQ